MEAGRREFLKVAGAAAAAGLSGPLIELSRKPKLRIDANYPMRRNRPFGEKDVIEVNYCKHLRVKHLFLHVTAYQDRLDDVEFYKHPQFTADNDLFIRPWIDYVRSQGMGVSLRPLVDIVNPDSWRGLFAPKVVKEWFGNLTRYLIDQVHFAADEGVKDVCIASEYYNLYRKEFDERWMEVFRDVRAEFDGNLIVCLDSKTIRKGYHEEMRCLESPHFDTIGISAYFPLATKPGEAADIQRPTEEEARRCWEERVLKTINTMAYRCGKSIEISEIGYQSVVGANHAYGSKYRTDIPDQGLQDNLYRAFLGVADQIRDLKGIYLWLSDDNRYDPSMTWGKKRGLSVARKKAEGTIVEFQIPKDDVTTS